MFNINFSEYLNGCMGLSVGDVLFKTISEADRVKVMLANPKMLKRFNQVDEAKRYLEQIKAFSFYLQQGIRPQGGSFPLYLPLVEQWVESGEFKSEALLEFAQ